jgi:hypothetical protein
LWSRDAVGCEEGDEVWFGESEAQSAESHA